MEEKNIYEEIANFLKRTKVCTDDVVITYNEDEVRITAGESGMICNYMMRRIYVAASEFKKNFFVHLNIGNMPEVIIYE